MGQQQRIGRMGVESQRVSLGERNQASKKGNRNENEKEDTWRKRLSVSK